MTEKVKITQKQFDWLERYKSDEEIDYAIDIQLHKKRPDSPIVDWSPSEIARAFYKGYEVELKFKVGDWVVNITGDDFYPIGNVKAVEVLETRKNDNPLRRGEFYAFYGEDARWGSPFGNLRHATPEEIKVEKERRKWAGIEEGDVVRLIPWADKIGILIGNADDETVLVQMAESQKIWRKEKVELYAKKVGEVE